MSETLIELLDREEIPLAEFIAVCGYQHQDRHLQGMRPTLDDEQAVEMIGRLAGTFLRFPTPNTIGKMLMDFALVRALNRLEKAAKDDNLQSMHLAQRLFEQTAKKIKITGGYGKWNEEQKYEAAIRYAQAARQGIRDALAWDAQHRKGQSRAAHKGIVAALTPEEQEKIDRTMRGSLIRARRRETGRCIWCGEKLPTRCAPCQQSAAERHAAKKLAHSKVLHG